MKKIGVIFFIIFFFGSVFAQSVNEYYSKIEKKLTKDSSYLNLYSFTFRPTAKELEVLKDIPVSRNDQFFNFSTADNVEYTIVFMMEDFDTDSTIVLYVTQTVNKAMDETVIFEETGVNKDESTVLRFEDVQELYFHHKELYDELYKIVENAILDDQKTYLAKLPKENQQNKIESISERNNRDFLDFARVNNIYTYPKDAVIKSGRRSQKKDSSSVSSFKFDLNFSHLSFYHKAMDFGFSGTTFEINLADKFLNFQPWESMCMYVGLRTLVNISGKNAPFNDATLIDARIMGRFRINTLNLVNNLPFLISSRPKLNFGSGVVLDIYTTRLFGLPFLNFYYASGSPNYTSPFTKSGTADSSLSYFTSSQMLGTMSFFWNNSVEKSLRYKLELGIGKYDVVQAYNHKGNLYTKMLFNQLQPYFSLTFIFIPEDDELFSGSIKMFDSQFNLGFWLKLFEIKPDHLMRLETSFITAPLFRSPRGWESENGRSIIQLRYRFGF